MALTTLLDAKTYLGFPNPATPHGHDAEIERYVAQADGVIQTHAGPAVQRATFVERYLANGPTLLLDRYPVVSVTSIGSVAGDVSTLYTGAASDYAVVNAEIGRISTPYSSGQVEVTYAAGLATPPAEAVDAALLFISYKYRRNHGGSETYMPSGVDSGIAPPMGVTALKQQIRLALGEYAKGATLA